MKPMKGLPDVAFIICTHNGSARIGTVLQAIWTQHAKARAPFEVIIVDNASTDNVSQVARQTWAQLGAKAPLFVVREERPGVMYARLAGAHQARSQILCFIDDDNYIIGNWADTLVEMFERDPDLGVVGAVGTLPTGKPRWFPYVERTFAVGAVPANERERRNFTVYGAGMTVRSTALMELRRLGITFQFNGHSFEKIGGADDSEICLYLIAMGYRIAQSSELTFVHDIAPARLTQSYMRRLARRDGLYTSYLEPAFGIIENGKSKSNAVAFAFCILRAVVRLARAMVSSVIERNVVPLQYHLAFMRGYLPYYMGRRDHAVVANLDENIRRIKIGANRSSFRSECELIPDEEQELDNENQWMPLGTKGEAP
jgi:glycosyltransferase involved in cell wall biosynthesis